jgi:hypothetical protein
MSRLRPAAWAGTGRVALTRRDQGSPLCCPHMFETQRKGETETLKVSSFVLPQRMSSANIPHKRKLCGGPRTSGRFCFSVTASVV